MKACPPRVPSQVRRPGADSGGPEGGLPPERGLTGWLRRASQPVLVRLPRGFLLLAGVVVLLAIVLAYWVGVSLGRHWAVQEYGLMAAGPGPAQVRPSPNPPLPLQPPPGLGRGPQPEPVPGRGGEAVTPPQPRAQATGPVRIGPVSRDLRQPGLNYYVANVFSQADAAAFTAYLWQEGVEAEAVKVHNSRSFLVVVLQGFKPEELGSAACAGLGRELQQLARQFNAAQRRQTVPVVMYAAKYQGGAVETVLTKVR